MMDLLTVKETARILRVSPITVRRYVASGRLPAERVGRGIRVRREAIEDFVTPIMPQTNDHEPHEVSRDPSVDPRHFDDNWVEIWSPASPDGTVWVHVDQLDEYLDERATGDDHPPGNIVGIGRSGEPTNIAEHKDEYVADAILASSHDDEDVPAELADRDDENLVEIYSPSSPTGVEFVPEHLLGKPITADDPLWNIIGIGESKGPNDVARNKHKYLADAILSRKSLE